MENAYAVLRQHAGRRALVTIVGTRGQGSDGGRHGSSLRDATGTLNTVH